MRSIRECLTNILHHLYQCSGTPENNGRKNAGFFWSKDTIIAELVERNIGCLAILPWTSRQTQDMSMALPRSSPYYRYFVHTTHTMIERGILHGIKLRWIVKLPSCPQSPVSALQLNKLFTLFLFYGVAVFISILLCMF
jgi:hypothetical protein